MVIIEIGSFIGGFTMQRPGVKLKLMFWYKSAGRIVYFLILLVLLIATVVLAHRKNSVYLLLIVIDFTMILSCLILEISLTHYSHMGTKYVEASRRLDKYMLSPQKDASGSYYVNNAGDGYIVKIEGHTYFKTYKKETTSLKEDASIETPYVEITTIERLSRAADNEYSIFAAVGEKNTVEETKIVLQNKNKNIKNYVS